MDDELFTQTLKPFIQSFKINSDVNTCLESIKSTTQEKNIILLGCGFENKKSTKIRKGASHGPEILLTEFSNYHKSEFDGLHSINCILPKTTFLDHDTIEENQNIKINGLDQIRQALNPPQTKAFIIGGSCNLSRFLAYENQTNIVISPYEVISTTEVKNKKSEIYYFGAQGDEFRAENESDMSAIVWLETNIRQMKLDKPHAFLKTQAGKLFEEKYKEILFTKGKSVNVILNLNSIKGHIAPGTSYPSCGGGLTAEEVNEIAYLCGLSRQVEALEVNEFVPSVEKTKTCPIIFDLLYNYTKGHSDRQNVMLSE